MPSSFNIHPDLDLVHLRHTGHVAVEDLIGVLKASRTHPDYRAGMKELSDCSQLTGTDITLSEVSDISQWIRRYYGKHDKDFLTCQYAPGALAFGMCRMYHTLIQDVPNLHLALVDNAPEALAFLDLPPETGDRLFR